MSPRLRQWTALLGLVAVTVAVRLPALLSSRHIDFDEGVYGVSVLAMRDGAAPFRDVFSSQGPLFLPYLWLFDTVGGRQFGAVRIGMLVAAIAFTLGVFVLARRATAGGGLGPAVLAALVVTSSTAAVAAAGPLHSDGPALAAGVWALAVSLGAGPFRRMRPVVVGLLLGVGIATKSVFLAPVAVALAWRAGRTRDWAGAGVVFAVAAAVPIAAALPWGLGDVWDQNVAFHLAVPRERNVISNIAEGADMLVRRDMIFGVFALAAAGLAIARLVRRVSGGVAAEASDVFVWLGASLLFVLFAVEINQGFYRYLVFLIAPAMVAFAALRPPPLLLRTVGLVALVLIPLQLRGAEPFLGVRHPSAAEREVVTRIAALPDQALVISDEPGLAWMAGRHPPVGYVDTSWARIRAGDLTPAGLRTAIAQPDVCMVLLASGRFAHLDPTLTVQLPRFETVPTSLPDAHLYERGDCIP